MSNNLRITFEKYRGKMIYKKSDKHLITLAVFYVLKELGIKMSNKIMLIKK